jgi:alginate O-acetyltransferase complex protein AlgI
VLLVASFVFYSWLSWRFGVILFMMSVCGYFAPFATKRIDSPTGKKLLLVAAIVAILIPLFVLKYWDFVACSTEELLAALGWTVALARVNHALPPGISFHSFQLISYVVDVFRKKFPVERRLGIFFLFSSYFPQLVAGPIERAAHLIPQLPGDHIGREDAEAAFQFFLYGLFLKVAVADVVGVKVDQIYLAYSAQSGAALLVATALFYVQIYCDFAGYSLMAIGVARALGVQLVRNFDRPVVALSPIEFWHRWHISLSQWFRDYVYIPLGGSRTSTPRWVLAVMVTFLASGLWHGANWTFLAWGGVHGAGLLLAALIIRITPAKLAEMAAARSLAWLGTQLFVTLTWVFFRARSIGEASDIFATIARDFLFNGRGWFDLVRLTRTIDLPPFVIAAAGLICIWVLTLDYIISQTKNSPPFGRLLTLPRFANEFAMIAAIAFAATFGPAISKPFIYFQF